MNVKERIGQVLDVTLQRAKSEREAIPYSRQDAFANVIIILGPAFQVATMPGRWSNEEEKYRLMRAVSKTANDVLAMAVILVTDTRWVEGDKVAPLLGIPTIEEVGLDKWQKLYRAEIQKRFKGYLGNMPQEWYSEAIVVIGKGPGIGTLDRFAPYEKGPNDSIQWLPSELEHTAVQFNLLPDWWC